MRNHGSHSLFSSRDHHDYRHHNRYHRSDDVRRQRSERDRSRSFDRRKEQEEENGSRRSAIGRRGATAGDADTSHYHGTSYDESRDYSSSSSKNNDRAYDSRRERVGSSRAGGSGDNGYKYCGDSGNQSTHRSRRDERRSYAQCGEKDRSMHARNEERDYFGSGRGNTDRKHMNDSRGTRFRTDNYEGCTKWLSVGSSDVRQSGPSYSRQRGEEYSDYSRDRDSFRGGGRNSGIHRYESRGSDRGDDRNVVYVSREVVEACHEYNDHAGGSGSSAYHAQSSSVVLPEAASSSVRGFRNNAGQSRQQRSSHLEKQASGPISSANFSLSSSSSRSITNTASEINYLTGMPYDDRYGYRGSLPQRMQLPMFSKKKELQGHLATRDVIIITGDSCVGKSTQVPQFAAEFSVNRFGRSGRVVVTVQSDAATQSLASKVAVEAGVRYGGAEVGSRDLFQGTNDGSAMTFMTEEKLLSVIVEDGDKTFAKYSVAIIDNAHTMTVHTEILLRLLKEAVQLRTGNLKLIIISDSASAELLLSHFIDAHHISVPGPTFPINVKFVSPPVNDYIQAMCERITQIHFEGSAGDILVFAANDDEVKKIWKRVEWQMKGVQPSLECFAMYTTRKLDKLFDPMLSADVRRCIISAGNVALSAPIPNIAFVIDSGRMQVRVTDLQSGIDCQVVEWISKAVAEQRTKRATLLGGKCYRLYTRQQYDQMRATTIPEIERTNLASSVLKLSMLQIDDPADIGFLHPPPPIAIQRAYELLQQLGAMETAEDGRIIRLTPLGRQMVQFPVDPRLAKMLLTSAEYGYRISSDAIAITSVLASFLPVLERPDGEFQLHKASKAHARFRDSTSDLLTMRNIYKEYRQVVSKDRAFKPLGAVPREWCLNNYVSVDALARARTIRCKLSQIMDRLGLSPPPTGATLARNADSDEKLRRCIVSALFMQVARRQCNNSNAQTASKHSSRVLERESSKRTREREKGRPSVRFDGHFREGERNDASTRGATATSEQLFTMQNQRQLVRLHPETGVDRDANCVLFTDMMCAKGDSFIRHLTVVNPTQLAEISQQN